jgi:hypothetical protein
MASRRRTPHFGVRLQSFVTRFYLKCEFGLYVCFCATLYSQVLKGLLPENYSVVVFWLLVSVDHEITSGTS